MSTNKQRKKDAKNLKENTVIARGTKRCVECGEPVTDPRKGTVCDVCWKRKG